MSTNALVSVKHTDGTIKAVYVHWDGDSLLPILCTYYNTPELAEELVSLGNISSLGERIHPIGIHSFNERESGTTTFYHRDRGDNFNQNIYNDMNVLMNESSSFNYIYYFTGINWITL
jgi:hypothetical protein